MWFMLVIIGILLIWIVATIHFIWRLLKTPIRELRAQGFTDAKIQNVRGTFPQWVRKDEKNHYIRRILKRQ
jgi:hypothetical protein